MYTTIKYLGKQVIQTNPSKFDERLFSEIYLRTLRLKQGREIRETETDRQTDRQTDRELKLENFILQGL